MMVSYVFIRMKRRFLLSCINPYQRNGKSDPDDHNIFLMTQKEFGDCIDALRDGDYVFVIE